MIHGARWNYAICTVGGLMEPQRAIFQEKASHVKRNG
jgi:hypothetical protein